jgi:hypothetical protein
MQERTATGNLIQYELLQERASFAAVLARGELEAALHAQEPIGLWFELGHGGEAETSQLTLELTPTDVEEMLQSSPGDDVIVALDADEVERVFADVEAHGMRGALAIAVATAAIAAPTSMAASPEVSTQVSPEVSAQVSAQVSPEISSQVSRPATQLQVSSLVANTQVSPRVVRPAAIAQVKAQMAKAQLHKSLVVKGAGVKLLGSGLAG